MDPDVRNTVTDRAGIVLASGGTMGKVAALEEAQALVTRLSSTIREAEEQIQTAGDSPEKLSWLGVAKANLDFMEHLLARLNNGGINLWRAREIREEGRAVLQLVEGELSRYSD